MSPLEIELDPVSHITTDAIGKPGERVFYLQARSADRVVTLLIEKAQVISMAAGVAEFLEELAGQYPDLVEASADYVEESMRILPPVDPVFRAGDLGMAYDAERDLVCLIAREILNNDMTEESAREVRFWCTRAQIKACVSWGQVVVNRGRPICPQCGEPMDPAGHFCPKKNGHKH